MEAYWDQDFEIPLKGKETHNVKLYQYSERSIALITTSEFGKAFAKNFKSIEGRFNPNLKINEEKKAGWVFKAQTETLEKLNNTLKSIFEGEIKPQFTDIIMPDFTNKSKHNKIYNLINKLMDIIPEETEEFVISDDEKAKTTIYYNSNEDTVTEGELVYNFEGGKKKLEIYQLVL